MPVDDFDVERLAAYLHLDPAEAARLADRGRLPGRKVAGQWRFSPREIHDWLEERIGLSTDEELQHMEGALRRPPGRATEAEVAVAPLLPLDAIAIPLAARTRGSVITSMCELAARTGWLWDPAKMAAAVRPREDMLPTALESGVATVASAPPATQYSGAGVLGPGPHGSAEYRSAALHGVQTDFFLVCSVEDRGHLRLLARLSRLISLPQFLDELRTAGLAACTGPDCPPRSLGRRLIDTRNV